MHFLTHKTNITGECNNNGTGSLHIQSPSEEVQKRCTSFNNPHTAKEEGQCSQIIGKQEQAHKSDSVYSLMLSVQPIKFPCLQLKAQ